MSHFEKLVLRALLYLIWREWKDDYSDDREETLKLYKEIRTAIKE